MRDDTSTVVCAIEHDGVTGYGEASMPPYLGETQAGAAAFLDRIAALLGDFPDPFRREEILPAVEIGRAHV